MKKLKLGGNPKEIQKNRAKKLGRIVDSSSDDSSSDGIDLKSVRIAKKVNSMPLARGVSNTSTISASSAVSGGYSVSDRFSSSGSSTTSSSRLDRSSRLFNRSPSPDLQDMDYDPFEEKFVRDYNVERGITDDVQQRNTVASSSKYHQMNGVNPSDTDDALHRNTWLEGSHFVKLFQSHDQLDDFYKAGWMLSLQPLGARRKSVQI